MLEVVTGLAVIATVIAVGWLVGRLGVLGPHAQVVLSRVTFFVATPALLLQTLARADVRAVFSTSLVAVLASTLPIAAAYALVARVWLRRSVADATVGALASSYVNAGNIGLALAVYVLGDAAYVAPVLLYQLLIATPIAFVVLDTAGARSRRRARVAAADDATPGTADGPDADPGAVAGAEAADGPDGRVDAGSDAGSDGRSRRRWRAAAAVWGVVRPVLNPITIACALGVVLSLGGWTLPAVVARPVDLVGAMAVPAALLAYGLSLHGAPAPGSGGGKRDVWLAVALKNVAHPVLAYVVARHALGLDGTALLAATLVAALPTAQNVFVYAVRYDSATRLARDAILLTTSLAGPVLLVVAALVP